MAGVGESVMNAEKLPEVHILAPCKNHNDRKATKAFFYQDTKGVSLKFIYVCDECKKELDVRAYKDRYLK